MSKQIIIDALCDKPFNNNQGPTEATGFLKRDATWILRPAEMSDDVNYDEKDNVVACDVQFGHHTTRKNSEDKICETLKFDIFSVRYEDIEDADLGVVENQHLDKKCGQLFIDFDESMENAVWWTINNLSIEETELNGDDQLLESLMVYLIRLNQDIKAKHTDTEFLGTVYYYNAFKYKQQYGSAMKILRNRKGPDGKSIFRVTPFDDIERRWCEGNHGYRSIGF